LQKLIVELFEWRRDRDEQRCDSAKECCKSPSRKANWHLTMQSAETARVDYRGY